ncbi:Por secretion system C-terminal sorting domain-containing protein [Nonlabens sp. Hel1_33_55]|uniref:LamG-like jellyroll fold domain-containing protein n=1 Tax=Nonlabens sp. Hel1_33_55 TaxID=1336802 RepID=UPI000875E189|nr:LamG-like jellyroll fold domain-containing protein [Nonlabens sp. Hel1_33_55]SCY00995.1 Por secretion system C-terminal sorting domain-containing protein [Nonlabens sp. Hel1_33_55]
MLKSTLLITVIINAISYYAIASTTTSIQEVGSASFNGITDQIFIENEVQINDSFSISTWINTSSDQVSKIQSIVSQSNGSNGWSFQLSETNRIQALYFSDSTTFKIETNSLISYDVWRHVSLVYDGESLSIYIDGILDTSQSINFEAELLETPIAIGALAKSNQTTGQHFKGFIDEFRIWNTALAIDHIRFFMNQELINLNSNVAGSILPYPNDSSESLSWDNLVAYYTFNNGIAVDRSNQQLTTIQDATRFDAVDQTAPLPYTSITNGDWKDPATWNENLAIHAPNSTRVINGEQVLVNWNIVQTTHDIKINNSIEILSLDIQNQTIEVLKNQSLTITNTLKLDGTLDLVGESQLVQTMGSKLNSDSKGFIERDQQGSGNKYNYNYWSSPVSYSKTDQVNSGFDVASIMMDGTNPTEPKPLNFTAETNPDGSPATNSQAATVSPRWIHKYSNLASGTYANWQYVGNEGELKAGEAYSMKGTGASTDQNYTFKGLPNNGPIELNANAGNDYLIGNPYPSAMDARRFIMDNPQLDGTIYYWEHMGGESHSTTDYVGGYSMYNLSGGTPNATKGTADALVNSDGKDIKLPGRFIPVAQGFFVIVKDDGAIKFDNSQRVFEKENNGNSVFVSAPGSTYDAAHSTYSQDSDERSKIRIGFDSPNEIHRQILLTIDPNATRGIDRGYDGYQFDDQVDDMAFWMQNERFSIQGIGEVTGSIELPLYIKLKDNGTIKIGLDHIENLDDDQPVYLKDANTGVLHNLRESKFESPFLFKGQYKARFSIVFHGKSTLSNDTVESQENILVFTPQATDAIHISTPDTIVLDQVSLTNMLGQQVKNWEVNDSKEIVLSRNGIASGNYIVTMKSAGTDYHRKVMLR